jgi:hypothetical protein
MNPPKVRADFNGLFGGILCLSHEDTCLDENGAVFHLSEGLTLTAYDEDADENGNRDDLLAHGKVESAPAWLQSHGSKWVLRIDENGVLHESDMRELNESEHA